MKRFFSTSAGALAILTGITSLFISSSTFAQEVDDSSDTPQESNTRVLSGADGGERRTDTSPATVTPSPLAKPITTDEQATTQTETQTSQTRRTSLAAPNSTADTKKKEELPPSKTLNVVPGNAIQDSAATQLVDKQETEPSDFDTYFEVTSLGSMFDNLDFRKLAPPTDPFINIFDSDDRAIFATTRLGAAITYRPIEPLETSLSVSHTGLWGNDNIGSTNAFGGFLYVERLNIKWDIWKNDSISFDTTIGRQRFSIGGFADDNKVLHGKDGRDFLFNDVIDGVTINADFGVGGRLRLMPVDIFAVGARPKDINSASHYGPVKDKLFSMRFNGDYNTIRTGAIYENGALLDGLVLRGFGFFANIGAAGTGSDRSFRGATGNVIDNDYTWMAGAKVNYTLPVNDTLNFGIAAEFAHSGGIDRKATQAGYYDMATSGNAFGATLLTALNFGETKLDIPIQFFMADGGRYTQADGLPFSHGFVSFKGQQAGGLLLGNSLGWRPSGYIGDNGISQNPHDKARKSGSMVISAGVESSFLNNTVGFDLNFWYLKDTSHSSFNQKNINQAASQPAFGYTRGDLEALTRLGKPLASEIDVAVRYNPFDILSFYAVAGVLIPSEFYKIEIDRQVGTMIGSKNPATGWGISIGTTLTL